MGLLSGCFGYSGNASPLDPSKRKARADKKCAPGEKDEQDKLQQPTSHERPWSMDSAMDKVRQTRSHALHLLHIHAYNTCPTW